jgi:AcrR family transcriptional regulator
MGNDSPTLSRRASYGPTSPVVGERGVRTRRAILDAAVDVFHGKGPNGASVDDIAEAAGISRAALYQYFESKDELFLELLRAAAADLLAVIRRPPELAPTAEGYDSLYRWVAGLARAQGRYKTMYLQTTVVDSPPSAVRQVSVAHTVEYLSSMTGWLGSAVDDLDTGAVAPVLLGLLLAVNDYRNSGVGRGMAAADLLTAVAAFVQLVLVPATPVAVVETAVVRRRGVARKPRPLPAALDAAQPLGPPALGPKPGSVQRILDAGAAAFAARGYHASSVQDVLTAAGAGRGTFYRHFGDKADLLVQLSRECMARLVAHVDHFPAALGDGAALREWIEQSLALHRRYRGVFPALLRERTRDPALAKLRAQSLKAVFARLDGVLSGAPRSGQVDVRVGSLILLCLLERGLDYDYGTPYDVSDDRVIDILAVVIERGLLGGGSRPAGAWLRGRGSGDRGREGLGLQELL